MVDPAKLDQLLSNLKRYLGTLHALAATPRDVFLADSDKLGNAKYHLVIAIECCIDVANHVIASENFRFPKDNADSFSVLSEQGILEVGDAEALRAMSRFRNRLVHMYWEVDDARVYQYLNESLGDIGRFVMTIAGRTW